MSASFLRRLTRPRFVAALLLASIAATLRAADVPSALAAEAGLPPLRIFSPADYHGSYQTWRMVTGPDGTVYVGDFGGLNEFDGATWRRLAPAGLGSVRELQFLPDGRLYLTANDDFGYCARDDAGELRYTSLKKELPPEALPLGGIVSLVRAGDALYLSTEKGVVRWQPGRTHFWPSPAGSTRVGIYGVDGKVWRRHARATVISELRGDEWVTVLDAPELLNRPTPFFLSSPSGPPLIAVNQLGLFHLVDGRLVRWTHVASPLLDPARVTAALRLSDGTLAISTISEGVILLSADGQRARQLRMAEGLPSNLAVNLGTDDTGRLWICTYNGLAVFDWPAALTLLDRRSGFDPVAVSLLQRRSDGLLIGGLGGRFKLVPAAPTALTPPTLVRQPGNDSITSNTIEHPAGTLFPTSGGIRALRGESSELVLSIDDILITLTASKHVPGRVYFGSEKGLGSARWRDGRWQLEGYAPHAGGSTRKVMEDSDGSLWAATLTLDAWHVTPPTADGDWKQSTGEQLKSIPGWPGGVYGTEETPFGVIFTVAGTFLRYDRTANRFVPEDRLDRASAPAGDLLFHLADASGRLWAGIYPEGTVAGGRHAFGYFAADGPGTRYRWHALSSEIPAAIGSFGVEQVVVDPADSALLWLRGTHGIGRLDTRLAREVAAPPTPRLRRVALDGQPRPFAAPARFAFSRTPLRFEFAPGGSTLGNTRFETRLVGWNSTWTTPSPDTAATFTGLGAGAYTFEVRERSASGGASLVTRFPFVIAPPWHLSPLAFVVYALSAGGAVFGYLRWRLGRSEREHRRLEKIVAERTADLATARDAAEAASRAKSAFLASMSHELRTPLNGVIGYAQVLQNDRRLLSDQRERLRIVQNSGEHLLRMINDVLDLAKIEAGKLELRPAPFALADLVRDIVAAHAPTASGKRLIFTADLTPNLPAWVEGDAQKLRQVLDNLLGNAVKFTAAGSVTLRVSLASGSQPSALHSQPIAFAITDTGPGIDATDQVRLFQPFEQATRSRPNAPGAGLGLAIARALVERMGGTLTLDSAPGRGSTFAFAITLPVVAPDPARLQPGRRLTGYAGPRRHVLIVDDHAVNRSLLTDLLVPLGFSCIEFSSGESALSSLPASVGQALRLPSGPPSAPPWPDLAILDVRMDGMDGLELTRRLRAHPRGAELKILLTSASVLTFDPAEGRRAGCDDFLPKPFRTGDLVEKIGALLELTWHHAESATPFPASAAVPPVADVPLPPAVRTQLRDLLAQGDLEAFRAALTTLRPAYPGAESHFDALDQAAAAFELSRLRHLLDAP